MPPKRNGVNGRLAASFRVSRFERDLGYEPPPEYVFRSLTDELAKPLIDSLTNAGRHTIKLDYSVDNFYDFNDRGEEHRLEADLCPVEMRQIVMSEMFWPPPNPPSPTPATTTTSTPRPKLSEEGLSAHALRSLKSWWAEMTSDVVYDGPRG